MLTEYFFWFTQPSAVLNSYDWIFAYIFGGLFALSVVLWFVTKFLATHPTIKKAVRKFISAFFWIGLLGLIWFSLRYQTVPIFSRRFIAALLIAFGVIWIGYAIWYLFFKFVKEKNDYDYLQIKNKYIK